MNYRNIHNFGTKELYNYLKLLRMLTYTKTYITDADVWFYIQKHMLLMWIAIYIQKICY